MPNHDDHPATADVTHATHLLATTQANSYEHTSATRVLEQLAELGYEPEGETDDK